MKIYSRITLTQIYMHSLLNSDKQQFMYLPHDNVPHCHTHLVLSLYENIAMIMSSLPHPLSAVTNVASIGRHWSICTGSLY